MARFLWFDYIMLNIKWTKKALIMQSMPIKHPYWYGYDSLDSILGEQTDISVFLAWPSSGEKWFLDTLATNSNILQTFFFWFRNKHLFYQLHINKIISLSYKQAMYSPVCNLHISPFSKVHRRMVWHTLCTKNLSQRWSLPLPTFNISETAAGGQLCAEPIIE